MMQRTVFKNVDDFIAEMSESKSLIEMTKEIALRHGDAEMIEQSDKLLSLFANDAAILRELAKRIQKPDGTIQFGFTQDAWNLLRNKMDSM